MSEKRVLCPVCRYLIPVVGRRLVAHERWVRTGLSSDPLDIGWPQRCPGSGRAVRAEAEPKKPPAQEERPPHGTAEPSIAKTQPIDAWLVPTGWLRSDIGTCQRCGQSVLWCWDWNRAGAREPFDRTGGIHAHPNPAPATQEPGS